MKITKRITKINRTVGTDTARIKYIVIHYVGALGGAEANCNYYASTYVGASAHYYVGHAGEIYQSVEDRDIAWHCGTKSGYVHPDCRNSNSLGIELCVRTKKSQTATSRDWYFEDATVQAAIALTKQLMKQYNVPADRVIRHHDVTGKICPNPFVYNHTKHTWDQFKAAISSQTQPEALTEIQGTTKATQEQMQNYLMQVYPEAPEAVRQLIPLYVEEGQAEGIRGDIAFCQSCLETGNFRFQDTAVTLEQHNFCGMGVTSKGEPGNSFEEPRLGIRAQIQHLKAYANLEELSQDCVDPRFSYVARGCAPYVEWLGQQENPQGKGWATGAEYGAKILAILDRVLAVDQQPEEGGAKSYRVETTCDLLNIRSGPGIDYPVTGQIRESAGHKNLYTVIEESGNWGRLKSGAGWISLAYVKRIGMAQDPGVASYQIHTTCDNLNIRSGPGTAYPVTGQIRESAGHKNLYTVIEESGNWGRLKSGAGWISLAYVDRIP